MSLSWIGVDEPHYSTGVLRLDLLLTCDGNTKAGPDKNTRFCLGWSWWTCAAISFVFASRGLHDINGLRLLMTTEQSPGATGRQLLALCYLRGGLSFESLGSLERKERSAISLCPTAPRVCWDWQDAAADGWTARSCQHELAEISISYQNSKGLMSFLGQGGRSEIRILMTTSWRTNY